MQAMIWVLLFAALAAQVSSQGFTGSLVVTKDAYCEKNNIGPLKECAKQFKAFLSERPELRRCHRICPIYSDNCETLPLEYMACGGDGVNSRDPFREPKPSTVPLHTKITNFTLELFKKALPKGYDQNYILSPVLVQSLLSYLTEGASDETQTAMEAVLKLNSNDLENLKRSLEPSAEVQTPAKIKLDIASQIFRSSRVELLNPFRQSLKDKKVTVDEIDFSNQELAAKQINDWVTQKTRGKINGAVDAASLNPDTKLMLLNALYFNGTWQYRFNKTVNDVFHVGENEQSSVRMMHLTRHLRSGYTRVEKGWDSVNGFSWVELPYDGDTFSMIILMPKERFQLDRELEKFNEADLAYILSEIAQNYQDEVKLRVPEFKAESTVSLVEPLKQMGLSSVFDGENPFDKVSKDVVKVSEVKQKSYLAVNERGTVATSVTFAAVVALSLPRSTLFKVDQPFAAIIIDKQNRLPLFLAKICKPEKYKEESA
ncbi:serine protease inhibitor 42Dd-like [Anopheles ziemanni]|uniref:serine protease inhibitor 42Dd-like n=1 Tax=Anopheles coustani TaxID=139045 RepID=UPI0026597EC6|nr:serine protease inhibitor 42Dd-like [Anopheles coustani]XP_058174539.1 serine protease inhibitor 42Dd-like [Anopheles ziemanni]